MGKYCHFCRYSIDMNALRAKLFKENGSGVYFTGLCNQIYHTRLACIFIPDACR